MNAEIRYSIILEHNAEVLLANASMAQVEAFWDANDSRYFGLHMEEPYGAHVRVMVTDEMQEEEACTCLAGAALASHSLQGNPN
ncbi:hypothetical protein BGP84_19995 [Pseudomonas putida]|jgi:hypothetical protein|uniref:Uncharacterized protein n=1 Tax=Pseudomonas putida TaxID=303 RepID=A0A2S3WUS6_PSEPU|nr:hypothetical protein [Pseudomonas putida]POG05176.1 hypothetical protein BGP84_19995 [Pseudomonas putida]POG07911.1 hypothetical protein BGP85_14040 [Pseudomonas putida]